MSSIPLTRKKFLFSLSVFCLLICGWAVTSALTKNPDTDREQSYRNYFNSNYKIFSLPLPQKLEFAGEQVPLEKTDIRERFDRELLINTYWQSQTLIFHKKANRWFPVIEEILAEEGVPDDFKYLALIESGLSNVVSPAGATGYWQILRETARELGLEVNNEVDERYHVEKSTRAACKYLKQAKERFGSWSMAAASYNLGMHGLAKQVKRQQADDYYDLLLTEETSRYLFRILAAKEILSKPSQYGFHFRPSDLYPPYNVTEVPLDGAVNDFAEYAAERGINYKVLKILNPWLRDSFLTNPYKKVYMIKLPADSAFGTRAFAETGEDIIDTTVTPILH